MSLHVPELKGILTSLLAELGLAESATTGASGEALPALSPEQQLLVDCYRSGQIEPWAWRQHLNEDPTLAAHFRPAIAIKRFHSSGR
jgi:hypothetical protein